MTEEEKIQKRNEMIREYQEQVRKARYVEDGHFITLDVYKNFLKEHGYILTGYDGGGNINWDRENRNFFKFHKDFEPSLYSNMILIGNPDEWGEYMDGFYCKNIVENPFVKYLESDFTTLKIYSVVENEQAKGGWFGPREEAYYSIKLDKDLSREWIKYLVKICPEFATYQINKCWENKLDADKTMEQKQSLLAKKLAELQKESEELPIARDKEIKKNDEIISIIKEAREENINSSI